MLSDYIKVSISEVYISGPETTSSTRDLSLQSQQLFVLEMIHPGSDATIRNPQFVNVYCLQHFQRSSDVWSDLDNSKGFKRNQNTIAKKCDLKHIS